ncbi:MAG: hypothetical protein ACI4FO_00765 [Acutalibacteraceae bacterium]
MSEEKKNIDADSGDKINMPKVTTGGYSERYGGGYCEGSYVAPEIRDAATGLPENMKKQAKELGLDIKQRSGYLNFGAGIQIHMPDYVITIPTAFEWKTDFRACDVVAYSRDCADDIDTSPLVLELERVKLMKPLAQEELLIRQQNAAELIGGTVETAPLDYSEAIIVTDKLSDERLVKRVFVLVNGGFEIFSLKLTFLRRIDNIDEITKRIYYSLFMIKKPAEKQAEKQAEEQTKKQGEKQTESITEKQTEELEIEQKRGSVYLNFGAGIQIHMPDYVITIPDAFEWKCGMNGRDFTAYSKYCAADIDTSPLVIELARTRLLIPFTEEEFFISQKNSAELLGGTIETAQLDFAKAIIVTFRLSDERLVKRVFVLVNEGYEMFSLQLTFLGEIDNTDEITKRIYYSLYISQTGKNKNGN